MGGEARSHHSAFVLCTLWTDRLKSCCLLETWIYVAILCSALCDASRIVTIPPDSKEFVAL